MIEIAWGDARKSQCKTNCATLCWADPPYILYDRTLNEFEDFSYAWILDALGKLRVHSRLAICCDYRVRVIYEKLAKQLNLFFESEIIWHYNFGLYTRSKVVPSHNNILIYKLGRPRYYSYQCPVMSQRLEHGDSRANPLGRNLSSVWDIPRVPGNCSSRRFIHGSLRSQQPVELCERAVKIYTMEGDTIYDPFMGTGTMAVVCRYLKRNYYGQDVNERYVKEAMNRLEHTMHPDYDDSGDYK